MLYFVRVNGSDVSGTTCYRAACQELVERAQYFTSPEAQCSLRLQAHPSRLSNSERGLCSGGDVSLGSDTLQTFSEVVENARTRGWMEGDVWVAGLVPVA